MAVPRHAGRVPAAAVAALALFAEAACGGGGAAPAAGADPVTGKVNVFAAASLNDAFREEAAAFRSAHSAADVVLNLAGSSTLAAQVNQGAPADVFASADAANLQKVVDAGNTAAPPRPFAANSLQVLVAAGNPRGVHGLADLARPDLAVVLCAPAVPCGAYAQQALLRAGVRVSPKSQEQDVSAVASRVLTGEADAGIVYATDVQAVGSRGQGVEIPPAQNVVATYPVAPVKGGPNPAGGAAFIDFLLGSDGQAILHRHGFSTP